MTKSFRKALTIQFRAIYALLMREMLTRYGARKLGFIWAILETLIHVAIFSILRTLIGATAIDGVHMVLFLITGIVPFFYFRNVVKRTMGALKANKGLLVLPQLRFNDMFYARFILETATSILTLVVALAITNWLIADVTINNYLQISWIFLIIGLLGFGIGLVLTAIAPFVNSIDIFVGALLRVMYLTSGVLFSIDRIPERYHDLLYWNPMIHLMELIREGFFFSYFPVASFTDSQYSLMFACSFIFIGLIMVSRMKKWILR